MKKVKTPNKFHTPKSPSGIGDYYGSGFRNPIGKQKDTYGPDGIPKIKPKKPPKSLA